MRRVRYSVAMSLDGFIADRDGGYAWITDEPAIDFGAYLAKIDTLLMGRGTYETAMANPGGLSMFEAMEIYVVSTTLKVEDIPGATLISGDVEAAVRKLKGSAAEAGGEAGAPRKDIWLFGGGVLFRSLLEAGLVDRVEVAVVPVLLGEGVPVLPGLGEPRSRGEDLSPGAGPPSTDRQVTAAPPTAPLALQSSESFDSGMVLLKYDVNGS